MLMDEARDAVRVSVAKTAQILHLSHIAFYDLAANQLYGSIEGSGISQADMMRVAETGEAMEGMPGAIRIRASCRSVWGRTWWGVWRWRARS